MESIKETMEKELNKKYYYEDYYRFNNNESDINLEQFLFKHNRIIQKFKNQHTLPQIYKTQLKKVNFLGEGAFKKVYKVKDENQKEYALS